MIQDLRLEFGRDFEAEVLSIFLMLNFHQLPILLLSSYFGGNTLSLPWVCCAFGIFFALARTVFCPSSPGLLETMSAPL